MNVEMNFTLLDMGLFLCLVCNLGAICGRFRPVFGSVLFAVLFIHIKRGKAGDCRRPSPTIAFVSQSNAENRHKTIIFIKPHNFHILFSLRGDRTVVLV